LDMAINGHGLFVLKGSQNNQNADYYTRNGSFSLDKQGYVVNPAGLRLQGYTYDSAGVKGTNVGDLALGSQQSPAVATTSAKITMNLDPDPKTPAVGAFDPANPATTSDYATSTTVYDSLGKAHSAQMYFHNDGGGNFSYHTMVDGGDVTGGTAGTPVEIAAGTLTFNASGGLQSQTQTVNSANFKNATAGQTIAFDFGDDIASGGTGMSGSRMFAGASSISHTDIDGHAAGNLTDVSVNSDGTIEGTYDNGDKRVIAQVAIAAFQNEQGLTRDGNNLYSQSQSSGQPLVDVPGTGKRGEIAGGSLESSNVDLGTELVTLIAYQRAYEANSKTVTTADEMLSDVTNLKR
ncbi:MAG TPA: flagellar hook protein FlgE, partial [Kofleriaceae bacterium]